MKVYDVPLRWRSLIPKTPDAHIIGAVVNKYAATQKHHLWCLQDRGRAGDIVYAHPSRIERWLTLPPYVSLYTFPDGVEITKREGDAPPKRNTPQESIPWDKILSEPVIAIDTEIDVKHGHDPNPHRDKLLGVSIAWSDGDAYIPWETDFPWGAVFCEALDTGQRIVGHNAKFDTIVLKSNGFSPVCFTDDTMLMAYMHGDTLPLGLKALTREVLGREATELGPLMKRFGSTGEIPYELLEPYARADARNTYDLYFALRDTTDPLYYLLEIPMMHLLTDVELQGWRVDKDALMCYNKDLATIQEEMASELLRYGIDKPTVKAQAVKVLQDSGIILAREPSGRGFQLTKDELGKIDDDDRFIPGTVVHPICEPLLRFRQAQKRASTWVRAMEDTDSNDCIHPSFRQAPRSGRLSCSEPNVQNYPPEPRACLVADRKHMLLAADASQFELRIMAKVSGDPLLCKEFAEGNDIHERNRRELGLPDRRTAKNTIYGIGYGEGDRDLAAKLGRTIREAAGYIRSILGKYTVLGRWILGRKRATRELGYSETIMGRRRYIPDILSPDRDVRSHAERAAVNHVIQGSAADFFKLGQIFLTPLLEDHGARIVAQIHDEWVISTPNPFATYDALMKTREYIQPWLDPVPFVLDVKVGNNWKETK